MRTSAAQAKQEVLALTNGKAVCMKEKMENGSTWFVVRGADSVFLGRHKVAAFAWESASAKLKCQAA